MKSIIFDGRALRLYPFGKAGFSGGTEGYTRTIAAGLAERGYLVHIVTPDLDHEEHRAENEWWWPPTAHPTRADYVVAIHNLEQVPGYVGQHFVLMPNGVDPALGEGGDRLSAVACFSQCHIDLLTKTRPVIRPEICHITGLGVNADDYRERYEADHWHPQIIREQEHGTIRGGKVHGRILYANDPARGLWHTMHIFDCIRERMPKAELRIAYDFARQFEQWRWQASAVAEQMWWCKERIEQGNGVVDLGNLSREKLLAEQLSTDIHIMPSDPPNIGSQIHGMSQGELAAAGVPLLLSDIEAFPEVFKDVAAFMPVPGTMCVRDEEGDWSRVTYEDWAQEAVAIMRDSDRWMEMSRRGRAWAENNDWSRVIERWDEMLMSLILD